MSAVPGNLTEHKLRERAKFMRDAGHNDDAELDIEAADLIAALTSPPKAGAGEQVLLREAAELADEIWASLDEVRRETNLTDSWYSVAEIEGQRIIDFARRIATPEPRGNVRVTDEMVERAARGIFDSWSDQTTTRMTWDEALVASHDPAKYPKMARIVPLCRAEARAALEAALNPEQVETP